MKSIEKKREMCNFWIKKTKSQLLAGLILQKISWTV